MNQSVELFRIIISLGSIFVCCGGGLGAQPLLEMGSNGEVTEDGLHRVNQSMMDAAWVKPGLDLTPYSKLFFMPTGLSFRTVEDTGNRTGRRNAQTTYPISDATKRQLRTHFRETFNQDLGEIGRFEMSDLPGRDVLMVQGFLVDFISGAPEDQDGLSDIRLRLSWEATVVLELRDSMSNEILARTVERERVERLTAIDVASHERVQLIHRWSKMLCTRLEELADISRI